MADEQARVIVSPRFRYLGAGAAGELGEQLPGIVTTELVKSGHFLVVARQEAVEALTQTINRVASRDYIEAHPGATINISQAVSTPLTEDGLKELSVLQGEVRSQMIALGVDYVVYGKYYDAQDGELRIEIYGLEVEQATLQGAEPVQAPHAGIEHAVQAAAGRLAARIRRVIEERRKGRRLSLAVLPFQSVDPGSTWAHWSSGMTEELIAALQSTPELQLFDRSRTRRYRDTDQDTLDLAELGRELQVDLVLLGRFSVNEATRQVRVWARLVATATQEVLKNFRLTGADDEDTQAVLAREILEKLEVRPAAVAEVKSMHTENVSARDYVRIGLHHFDEGAFDRALDAFRSAVKLDPGYVEAHYHLGILLSRLRDHPAALEHFRAALGGTGDASFGTSLWTFDAGSRIWARPLLAEARVVACTEAGIVCAVDRATGELLWRTDLYQSITKTPALHADAILTATDASGCALDRDTGAVRWSVPVEGETSADVALDGDTAFFTSAVEENGEVASSTVCARDVRTGETRWRRQWPGVVAPPLAHDGVVFVAVADDAVHALRADTGEALWSSPLQGALGSAPVTDGERVYLVSGAEYAAALRRDTGEEAWRLPLAGTPSEGRPYLHEGILYAAVHDRLHVIEGRTGTLEWSYHAGFVIGALALEGGLLFLTSKLLPMLEWANEHVVVAIDVATRPPRGSYWRRSFGDALYGEIVAESGVLYVGNRDHNLYAINVARTHAGPVRSAEVWNRIGQVHAAAGSRREAVAAFEQAIELNPGHGDSHRRLVELYLAQGRRASAIASQQRYAELTRGEHDEAAAQQRLAELSGLQWTTETPGLRPLLLLLDGRQDSESAPMSPITPAPLVTEDAVYIGGFDGNMRRLDRATGREVWASPTEEESSIRSTPVLANGRLVFGSGSGRIYALDPATGEPYWVHEAMRRCDSSPAASNGVVFAGSDDGRLRAIDEVNGTLRWEFDAGRPIKSRPALAGGLVCFGCYDGAVYALAERDGALRWKFQTDDLINSSPTIADGRVFIGADDGHVYALALATGERAWQFEVQERTRSALRYGLVDPTGIDTFGFLPSTPAVSQGTVFAGANGESASRLYALDAATGRLRWFFRVESGEVGSPTVWRNVVFFGAGGIHFHDRNLYAVDVRDGSLRWRFRADSDVLAAPTIAGDTMVCASASGHVLSFDIAPIAGLAPERDAAYYRARARVLMDAGDHRAAAALLLEGRTEDPDDLETLVQLADCWEVLGERDRQREMLLETQRLDRSASASYWRLGALYLEEEQHDAAIEQFQAYIRVQTEAAKPLGYLFLGDARLAKGDADGARRDWLEGVARAATFLPARVGTDRDREAARDVLALLYSRVALLLFEKEEPIEASLDLELLGNLDDSHAEGLAAYGLGRGLSSEQAGDTADADACYAFALRASASAAAWLAQAAAALNDRLHRFDRGHALFRQLLAAAPDDSSMQLNTAEAALNAGATGVHELTVAALQDADSTNVLGAHVLRVLASLTQGDVTRLDADLRGLAGALLRLPADFVMNWDWKGTKWALQHGTLPPPARDWGVQLLDALVPQLDRGALAALLASPPQPLAAAPGRP